MYTYNYKGTRNLSIIYVCQSARVINYIYMLLKGRPKIHEAKADIIKGKQRQANNNSWEL